MNASVSLLAAQPAVLMFVLLGVFVLLVLAGHRSLHTTRPRDPREDDDLRETQPTPEDTLLALAEVGDEDLRRATCDAALASSDGDAAQLWERDLRGRLQLTAHAGRPPGQRSIRGGATLEEVSARVPAAMGARSVVVAPVTSAGAFAGVLAVGSTHGSMRPNATVALLASHISTRLERAALGRQATTDELTGLANRRSLNAALSRELSRAGRSGAPLAVAMLDLDHLKVINDTRGHQDGDRALREAAAAWARALRDTDLLSRVGGDEFVVLLPDCPPHEALTVIARMRALTPSGLTCSAGVASWRPGEDPVLLLGRADAALYAAKRAGRDRLVVAGADDGLAGARAERLVRPVTGLPQTG